MIDGKIVDGPSPKMTMVFQEYSLFPWRTIEENVGFGLEMMGMDKAQRKIEVQKRLDLVGLTGFSDKYPYELSGGMRQRAAVARALASDPAVMLMDEPFGALDAKVRKELRRWLARLHEEVHLTSVFVTHDQEEAMEVADRIVVMNKGVIEQIGSPAEVYENPASDFVYHFLGDANRLNQGDVQVLFRPHEVELASQPGEGLQPAEIRDIRLLGAIIRVTLKSEEQDELIEAEVSKDHPSLENLGRGDTLYFKPRGGKLISAPAA